jgi:hypothetical protein
MSTLTIAPMQWTSVRNIDGVEPVSESDTDCLAEIRDVLKKYGNLERFGIALLHSHFPLGDDEILLETTDAETRTLVLKPADQSEATRSVGTVWMLRDGETATMAWCRSYCSKVFGGLLGHAPAHKKEK